MRQMMIESLMLRWQSIIVPDEITDRGELTTGNDAVTDIKQPII